MKKRIVSVLVCLCLLFPAMVSRAANDHVRGAMKGVARVVEADNNGRVLGHGTAFAVAHHNGSTYFVTNLHCVETNPDGVFIILDDLTTGNEVKAEVLAISNDPNLDLVVLQTRQLNQYTALPLAHSSTVQIGDSIFALGFPGISDSLNDDETFSSRIDDITLTSGDISRKVTQLGYETYQISALISPGNSGGPTVNEYGAVVGVNTRVSTQHVAYNYAICIDYIMDALQGAGISFAKFDPEVPTQGSPADNNDMMVLVFVMVGVLVAVGVIIIIVAITSKNKAAPRPTAAGIHGGAAGAMPVQGGAMNMQPQPQQLSCTCGQFAGAKFPIGGKIALGRDPARCQIVFDGGAGGISSLHCEIVRTPSGLLLIDKGSTYGTFLKNGRKLNAGESIPLRSGDAFFLADAKNEFVVQ